MLLEGKTAVLYGAGGGIGRGLAQTFSHEGANLYLTGRTLSKVEALAEEIRSAGGRAQAAQVDALDEGAVEAHLQSVIDQAGGVDISFNLISRGDVQGIPLVDMTLDDYLRAVVNGLSAQFITARAAARHMTARGSGVILMITSGSGSGVPMMGSTPPADAAMEALLRTLAAEVGPQGVRVLGIWTAGVVETMTPEAIAAVNENMQFDEAGLQAMLEGFAQMTMLRRAPTLLQVAGTAAFLASDRAAGMTGTIINVTCGLIPH